MNTLLTKVIIFLISLYQKTLSPDHGLLKVHYPYGFCRFYPSCSEYAKQAIEKYGIVKGFFLTAHRLARCNPWTHPSIDKI